MKKVYIIKAVMVSLVFFSCGSTSNKTNTEQKSQSTIQTFNLDTTGLKSGEIFYQCEMDPEILSDKPGDCPKCGMVLTERTKQ